MPAIKSETYLKHPERLQELLQDFLRIMRDKPEWGPVRRHMERALITVEHEILRKK